MSNKRFRFYTLEELGKRYPGDLIVHDLGIDYSPDAGKYTHFIRLDQIGTTAKFDPDRDEYWMGEEVVEAPVNGTWYCVRDDADSLTVSVCLTNVFIRIQEESNSNEIGIHLNKTRLRGLINHLSTMVEYLE